MKKISIIAVLAAALGACDKYETVYLDCGPWDVVAKISNQKATLNISVEENNTFSLDEYYPELQNAKNLKVDLARVASRFSDNWVDFVGKIPGAENETGIDVRYNHKFKRFVVSGFTVKENHTWSCNTLTKLPVKIEQPKNLARVGKKERARVESCIDYIVKNAQVMYGPDGMDLQFKDSEGKWMDINQETALSLSKNWDFNDMKLYQNNADGYLFDYELDACDTMSRMQEFLKQIINNKE
ncbi:MAG: hypothetical protein LBJ73_02005 [Rickettsiales bacterium]|nr:hypothetical protein [Rickettsiales bacterium]